MKTITLRVTIDFPQEPRCLSARDVVNLVAEAVHDKLGDFPGESIAASSVDVYDAESQHGKLF